LIIGSRMRLTMKAENPRNRDLLAEPGDEFLAASKVRIIGAMPRISSTSPSAAPDS